MNITLTLPDQQVPRLQHALGLVLNLGRDATGSEAKSYIIQQLVDVVHRTERQEAINDALQTVVEPTDLNVT
jgi:hypothetical protein